MSLLASLSLFFLQPRSAAAVEAVVCDLAEFAAALHALADCFVSGSVDQQAELGLGQIISAEILIYIE